MKSRQWKDICKYNYPCDRQRNITDRQDPAAYAQGLLLPREDPISTTDKEDAVTLLLKIRAAWDAMPE